ncbi:MAG TPA: pyridoxamine 5'-phosphate oxidase family protein [Blastocatellia bacterium]|jgi:nitroimidazol reductase NimA-like FMN-containing flavoprotein (pyridoxamine 5'-phosphate oxidase superfamily)
MKEMTETLKEFCEKEELLRLAFIDPSGYPRVVPVWFVLLDGECFLGTGAASAKLKAIKKDPRVGWVIDGGPMSAYKGASFRGRAEEVTDSALRANIYDALGKKYFSSTDHPKFIEIFGKLDNPEVAYLRLIVEDSLTWEY